MARIDIVSGGLHTGVLVRGLCAAAIPGTAVAIAAAEKGFKRVKAKAEGVVLLCAAVARAVILLAAVAAAAAGIAACITAAVLLDLHDLAVGRLHFFKFILGSGIAGVQIGVKLFAFAAVRFFNLFFRGAGGNAQNAVWIIHRIPAPSHWGLAGAPAQFFCRRSGFSLSCWALFAAYDSVSTRLNIKHCAK